LILLFSFSSYGDDRELHSFPTRRSSDLYDPDHDRVVHWLIEEEGAPQLAAALDMITEAIKGPDFKKDIMKVAKLLEDTLPLYERSEEHTSELQSRENLVCRLLLEKKNKI